jgi:hypothetical protein
MQKSWRTVTFLSLVLTYVMSIVYNKQKWMAIGKQTWQISHDSKLLEQSLRMRVMEVMRSLWWRKSCSLVLMLINTNGLYLYHQQDD